MIHKFRHRKRMLLGQNLLFGSANICIYICIHTYFGLILAQSSKHRTWMGIDKPLPIQNLDDFWFTSASTPINNELKQALNHNWHAWIRVVLNAVEPEIIEKTRNTHKQIGASQRSFLYVLRSRF